MCGFWARRLRPKWGKASAAGRSAPESHLDAGRGIALLGGGRRALRQPAGDPRISDLALWWLREEHMRFSKASRKYPFAF